MRFIAIPVLLLANLSLFSGTAGAEAADGPQVAGPVGAVAQVQSCGCADSADLAARLKAVQAVIQLLDSPATAQAGREPFDASTFDSGLGEGILTAQMTAGGVGAVMPVADFDRYSCDITTVPFLGGSACSVQSLTAQFGVRQQVCRQSQSDGQGSDYWEGRMMSEVIRELRAAYAAEEAFINQQLARLTGTACQGSLQSPEPVPPVKCRNCLQYIMEGTQTFPVVGRIRMFSNSTISVTVNADGRVTGSGTILTELDMTGSPCKASGYNGVADILVSGQINGGVLDAFIDQLAGQTTSAAMRITCPPSGVAQSLPQQQFYEVKQRLRVPGPGVPYTEETIDLGVQTGGAMFGMIVLRLYLTGN